MQPLGSVRRKSHSMSSVQYFPAQPQILLFFLHFDLFHANTQTHAACTLCQFWLDNLVNILHIIEWSKKNTNPTLNPSTQYFVWPWPIMPLIHSFRGKWKKQRTLFLHSITHSQLVFSCPCLTLLWKHFHLVVSSLFCCCWFFLPPPSNCSPSFLVMLDWSLSNRFGKKTCWFVQTRKK